MSITLFGLLAVLGFAFSGFFLWKRALDEHLSENDVFDIYINASIWALIAGRIVSIILRFDRFGYNPLRWIALFSLPGIDGRAVLCVEILMILLGATKRRWDPWLTLDVYMPPLLLWQAAVIVLFWWQVAVLWLVWFLLLWWVEHQYRLWEWYRGRRGFARPGLVTSLWLIGVGFGFSWVAWLSADVVLLWAVGVGSVLAGVVLVYHRSGRVLKTDVGKLFTKRRPRRTT